MSINRTSFVTFVAAVTFAGQAGAAWACLPVEAAWLARQHHPTATLQKMQLRGAAGTTAVMNHVATTA
jgi:hypothetical protein